MIRTELINHIYLKGDASKMKNRILTIIIGFIVPFCAVTVCFPLYKDVYKRQIKSLVYLQKKKEANDPNLDFEDMLRVSGEKEEKE